MRPEKGWGTNAKAQRPATPPVTIKMERRLNRSQRRGLSLAMRLYNDLDQRWFCFSFFRAKRWSSATPLLQGFFALCQTRGTGRA